MNVVWAYRNLDKWRDYRLKKYKELSGTGFDLITWTLAKASAFSWKRFAPEFKRILYVDVPVFNFITELGLVEFWDKVEVVESFDKHNNFWANPKAYAQVRQTEPFWIMDLDVVLLKPINLWFDPTKNWVLRNIDRLAEERRQNEGKHKELLEAFDHIFKMYPEIKQVVNIRNMVSGGTVFYADPVIGTMVGYLLQGIQTHCEDFIYPNTKDIAEFIQGGALEEEGILGKVFDYLPANSLGSILEERYFYHFWGPESSNIELIQSILKSWFNFKQELEELKGKLKQVNTNHAV